MPSTQCNCGRNHQTTKTMKVIHTHIDASLFPPCVHPMMLGYERKIKHVFITLAIADMMSLISVSSRSVQYTYQHQCPLPNGSGQLVQPNITLKDQPPSPLFFHLSLLSFSPPPLLLFLSSSLSLFVLLSSSSSPSFSSSSSPFPLLLSFPFCPPLLLLYFSSSCPPLLLLLFISTSSFTSTGFLVITTSRGEKQRKHISLR